METAIHIGAKIDKDSAKNLADMVDKIFSSAFKHRMEQVTVQQAIASAFGSLTVENTSINGCNITGDKHIS